MAKNGKNDQNDQKWQIWPKWLHSWYCRIPNYIFNDFFILVKFILHNNTVLHNSINYYILFANIDHIFSMFMILYFVLWKFTKLNLEINMYNAFHIKHKDYLISISSSKLNDYFDMVFSLVHSFTNKIKIFKYD